MYDGFSEYLKSHDVEYEEQKSLAAMSPMGINTVAAYIAYPKNEDELIELVSYIKKREIPFIIAGRMSNILFRYDAYDGVVIITTKIRRKILAENEISLSCGMGLYSVISQLAEYNLGGFEGLVGIPGTVGGMVKQNAGAFGYEMSDCFKSAIIYDTDTQSTAVYKKADMHFSYRDSILRNNSKILLSATFIPVPKSSSEIKEAIREFKQKRGNTQPVTERSLGSIFKRIDGISAGYYIDKAGLKGTTVGAATVSAKHAGFIVCRSGATADDVIRLVEIVKERVYKVFNVELCEEIEII